MTKSSKTDSGKNVAGKVTDAEDAAGRFSLQRLSAAFARLTAPDSGEPADPEVANRELAQSLDEVHQSESADAREKQVLSPRMIVEGMLFVGQEDGSPMSNRSMAAHIRDVSPQEVDSLIQELNEIYANSGCSYKIVSEGAGYRMQLRAEFETVRQRMSGNTKQVRLSPQTIEVLSIVAYRQPVSAEDVAKVRGSRSTVLLNQLIRRGLLKLERPAETSSNPVYRTTERFNQLLNIRSPAELPQSEDLDDN
ncbi:SMC-Scp complex subunit ScpB [Bythopirellula polymerisocia]|uniref:Segregation and condensation protein B n=1 Tax=Bythopirellula polymerisocia TaxID=2528003 RepID=A0A5C6CYR1_9BACT|nr:SMC-Scp complex subunit ScpB [Bythopirellula polymerisocia]TWU30073.1 hypothetical protein Pla144_08590 [Bythopirellula polymerisocia]